MSDSSSGGAYPQEAWAMTPDEDKWITCANCSKAMEECKCREYEEDELLLGDD